MLVLVIEDEVDLATTLEYNLRAEGLTVRIAHSGRQGLASATADPLPDVIVLDLMLPDLSGTEICRKLREGERTRDIPVVMCTAKGEEIDRVVGFEVGADDTWSSRKGADPDPRVRRSHRVEGEPSLIRFGRSRSTATPRAWVDDATYLTALEFRRHAFLSRRGRVQTATLLSDVWASRPTSRRARSIPTSNGCARSWVTPGPTSRRCAG
jgi:two-component system phosphate regulon response regulator PhoB